MKNNNSPIYGLICTNALYAFDFMVVAIAMPVIAKDLNAGPWYTISFGLFTLSALVGVLCSGKIIDEKGINYSIKLSFSILFFGFILSAIAFNYPMFLFGRSMQGIGSGAIITTANAVINLRYTSKERPRIIATLNTAWVIPSLIAPGIGGLIIDFLNWQYIFWLQIPFCLISALLLYIPNKNIKIQKTDKTNATKENNLFILSLILIFAMGLILFALNLENLI